MHVGLIFYWDLKLPEVSKDTGRFLPEIVGKLNRQTFNNAIGQVYVLTSSTDEDIEKLYTDQDKAVAHYKMQQVIFFMGDMNAKVDWGNQSEVVGQHGLDVRNECGNVWVQWWEKNNQVIINTYFVHYLRLLWTWRSPDD